MISTTSATASASAFELNDNMNGLPLTHREISFNLASDGTSVRRAPVMVPCAESSRNRSDSAVTISGANCLKVRDIAMVRSSVAQRTAMLTATMTTSATTAVDQNSADTASVTVTAVRSGKRLYHGCRSRLSAAPSHQTS